MQPTIEIQEIRNIDKVELLAECAKIANAGFRLVQILALNSSDGVELSYSFGREFNMVSLRCNVPSGTAVPSITPVWRGAFLYENEIKDLFGVNIENISVDYHGKFYDVAKEHPFAVQGQKGDSK